MSRSPENAHETGSGKKRQRSGKVCTACRQIKVKCDAGERFPNPCSKCNENSTTCRIDPLFRRTRKRTVVQVEQSPQETVVVLETSKTPKALPPNRLQDDEDTADALGIYEVIEDRFPLGTISLTLRQVNYLFELFFKRYHRYCPLFLTRRDAVQTYITERFLFWTIVYVAARTAMTDAEVEGVVSKQTFVAIMDGVKALATALSVYTGRTLGTVQGLILLSQWEPPYTRQKDSRSWPYINLATQTGPLMGLHRPFHSFEFTSRPSQQALADTMVGKERTLAWIMCHTLSHILALDSGVPAMIMEDWVSVQASAHAGEADLPEWLSGIPDDALQALAIARNLAEAVSSLGNSITDPSGQLEGVAAEVVWRNLDRTLADYELRASLPPHLKFILHLNRCQLSCHGLQTSMKGARRAQCVSELYAASIAAITLAGKLPSGELSFWPRAAVQGLKPVTLVLLRLIASEDGKELPVGPVLAAVSTAYRLVSGLNTFDNDKYTRAAKLIAFTSKDAQQRKHDGRLYGSTKSGDYPEIRCRMGMANYYHDCLFTAKRARGRHGAVYQDTLPASELAVAPEAAAPPIASSSANLSVPVTEPQAELFVGGSPPLWMDDPGFDLSAFDSLASDWTRGNIPSSSLFGFDFGQ